MQFKVNEALPPALASRPSSLENWSQEDVAAWFATLKLSCDYSLKLREGRIDGGAFSSVIEGYLTWNQIGIALGDEGKIKKALKEQKII